jgi:methionyl-tRNA synthetase
MSARYLDGELPSVADAQAPADRELRDAASRAVAGYRAAMERHHLDEALAAMMDLAGAANGYAESQAPWALNKAGERERVGQVLACMAEACRIIGHLLAPVAPVGARRIHEQLGAPAPYDERGAGGPGLEALVRWGAGPSPWRTGTASPIFPRLDLEATA